MGRVLNDNVWVDSVMYAVGSTYAEVGVAAGAIGDHAWRVVADVPAATPASSAVVVASRLAPEVVGPSPFGRPTDQPAVDVAPVMDDDDPAPEVDEDQTPTTPLAIEVPPQAGPGSSAQAWRDYAAANHVMVGEDEKRPQIIEAVKAAGVRVE